MDRTTYLGGTDIAAVMGVHPYRSPLQVYAEKRGLAAPFAGNEATWLGEILEPALAAHYSEKYEANLAPGAEYRDGDVPYFVGHPDRIVMGGNFPLEIKTVGHRSAARWGEEGTDEVPEEYLMQGQWYMMLTDSERCDMYVGFLQERKGLYVLERNDRLIEAMRDAAQRFWEDFVQKGVPPPVTDAAIDSQKAALRAIFPRDFGSHLKSSTESQMLMEAYKKLEDQISELEASKTRVQTELMQIIGNAPGIEGPMGRIDWKITRGNISWKEVAEKLFDLYKADRMQREQISEESRGASYRRFRIYWAKGVSA